MIHKKKPGSFQQDSAWFFLLHILYGQPFFIVYCDRMTPRVDTPIPIHWREFRSSCPRIHAMMAAATGIRAENMLDLATPRFLIVLTHNENARLEQSTARHMIGYHTSGLKCVSTLNPSRPFHMKSGRRYTEPIRNWYITIIWLE